MKSSTVRRSALSRESMDIIENLANETPSDSDNQYSNSNDYTPSEYYRETNENVSNNKSKEIDLLWQSFKSAQFNTNSPFMHFLGGFILGVIVTALTISLFGMFAANSGDTTVKNKLPWFGAKSQVQQLEDADIENTDNNIIMNKQIKPSKIERANSTCFSSFGSTKKFLDFDFDKMLNETKRHSNSKTNINIDELNIIPKNKTFINLDFNTKKLFSKISYLNDIKVSSRF